MKSYNLNYMETSKLSAKCRDCEYRHLCDNKQLEAYLAVKPQSTKNKMSTGITVSNDLSKETLSNLSLNILKQVSGRIKHEK